MKDDPTSSEFQAGQVWRYDARPHEQFSRVEILKVEREGDETLVHIRLVDVAILNPALAGGHAPQIDHLPMTASALRASVTERIVMPGDDAASMEAYHSWREAFELGEAGVFDIPLKQITELLEHGVAQILASDRPEEENQVA